MATAKDPFFPAMQNFFDAGQELTQSFLAHLGQATPFVQSAHPGLPANLPAPDAAALAELQRGYLEQQTKLWHGMLQRGSGAAGAEDFEVKAEPGDRRFAAPDWRESPIYDYMRQVYLLNSRYVKELVELVPLEDDKAKNRLRFAARQYVDAMAPTNFAATNPEFVRTAVETQGKSISDGISNLIADMEKGRISMTDESVFEVGRNLATTPGAVVFENELMQLIQYAPTTATVAARPFLIVPPCINKYYILDLQPENSFVRYAVDQGHTVFLISWRNAKAEQGRLTWDDYLEQAPIKAIELVREISKSERVNLLGFCVGGTILSSALAVLKGRGEDPAASLTLLTTLLDFSDTGEIGLFIDEQMIAGREQSIGKGGLMAARELANTFSSLRANDLVWNYVASNYLKGKKPEPFDLLYWNSDSTNLPGPFACWYMRNLYLNNLLRVPGRLEMCGVRIDLGALTMPTYLLATREDHIVPWQTAYLSTRLLGGPTRFVLGASGHIAGVINPASKNKRSYWRGGDQKADAEGWLASTEEVRGSWWSDWAAWLKEHAGGEIPAPQAPGNARLPVIEAAPGRYVKERA